ncbi:XF1762 family protein [Paenibacillus naphthalenovorans]|uniref:XF1762 family protein n=1 Tax=Paenibacillus naphthalenovorans TaxID=162209 RepID=UPI003D2E0B01
MLETQPITFDEACEFVKQYHRHHIPPQGHKFSIAVADENKVVGVIMIGRPVARAYDNGRTLEVIRCCTDGTPNAPSKLYAAAWQAARAMGYRRLITYSLAEEPGTSLRAAGWKALYQTKGGSWNCPTRPRLDKHPTGQKTLWEVLAD